MPKDLTVLICIGVLDEQGDRNRGATPTAEDLASFFTRLLTGSPLISTKMEDVDAAVFLEADPGIRARS
ncbi:MAG: hypothetical protein B9S38_08080 [Verrucomicrobiia bacterium Tous-C4TDCM]|nr:MAG: hypothetical protein B9S38_08080 [Verrucomicrobiae bacterium Tous-C4TDCM]